MPAGDRPNLVFIFPDQLRARALPVYGEKRVRTPHIDRLAEQSMVFDHCISPCPVCTPFRSMLLTGRYPQTTGHIINSTVTRHDEISIGDTFARAGYQTAWIGKWHLHRGAWPGQGVPDWVPEGRDRLGFNFWRGYNQHCKYFNGWVNGTDWHPIQWDGYETEALNRFAFKFLDEAQQRDEPFCLFISPQPPHWGEPPEQMAPSRYYEDLPASENLPLDPDVTEFDLPNRRKDLRQYLAMIRAVDDMVGDLVAQLTRRQLIDNTLLVFTSDHGTQGGREQLSFWAKMHPHEASIRVPLIVRWPGMIPAGVRNNSMMSAVDFLPTLASLCGIDAPRGLEGMDLSASWMGQPNAPRRDHTLLMNFGRKHDYFADGWEWRGIRTMTHTYARWLNGRTELFDIIADPYQLQNLAGTPAVAALQSDLEQCLTDRLAERADHFGTCTSYRAWHDSLRRVVRNGFGPLPHPESEPDWTRFCQPTHP